MDVKKIDTFIYLSFHFVYGPSPLLCEDFSQ